jgi:hypothetical protein
LEGIEALFDINRSCLPILDVIIYKFSVYSANP